MIAVTARAHSPVHDDFWVASGHHLVDRNADGRLVLTDAFLRAYLARPELVPPDEACPVERGLHGQLLANPRIAMSAEEVALVADSDGRENLGFFLAFRDHLVKHATLEAAYMALLRTGLPQIPPIFIQHLTHVIARNAFDECTDGRILRAAECFFRPQRITFHEGLVLLADEEAISTHEHDRKNSPLLNMLGGPAVTELDILTDENAGDYKSRSDAHDMVFDLTHLDKGRAALGTAMTLWMRHLIGFAPDFTPVDAFSDAAMAWFLSLDPDGTAIGNRVWSGETPSEEERARILALFTFTIPDHPRIREDKRGRPGFVVLGSSADRLLRMKPQNLVAGMPLAEHG